MRTTPALRTLAVALLSCGCVVTAAAGTAAAAPPTYADGTGGGGGGGGGHGSHGGPIWGTVVSHTKLNLRQAPTTHSPVVGWLSPGSQDRVDCKVRGQSVNGNPYWYWLVGAGAWASAAFVDTGGHGHGHRVPTCSDPCPEWKNGSWSNWEDPYWNDSWSASGSGSWSASGSWSWSASGSSSSVWSLLGGW
ncbi:MULTISPECIES: SH3 domain-containing protein [unclassified Streptomyces]|uniref:SH3 domain-containing protein n=1 Tax=unclassified Streptomyces TaxID=2593676 RepID=UPI001661B228|nr:MULTISPECIES: SH3 domain-containing protein [unclassified Streptomyces]MBD0842197.1 SH3 domain-containing protein [Streptomyces sp. TRM68416]